MAKKLTLKYLDETGFGLMLPLRSTWFKKGSGKQFKVPTRFGSQGRMNVLGSLSLHGEDEQLEYRELAGSCKQTDVVSYLESLFERRAPVGLTVVVLDNAAIHKGVEVRARQEVWEKGGMFLRFLPAYCPELNLVEGVWRLLKGFLMPRRCYDSVGDLRAGLGVALRDLRAVKI